MHQPTATTPLEGTDLTALAAEIDLATAPAVEAAATDYANGLFRAIVRILGGRRPNDADDIAAEAVVTFLRLPVGAKHQIMTTCPSPMQHARRIAKRTAIDFDRQERVQRCEGARLFSDREGGKRPGRRWISGDAPVGRDDIAGQSMFDHCLTNATVDIADTVVEQITDDARLEAALTGISPADRTALLRIEGHGDEVRQLAVEAGCARETMSRKYNRALRIAKLNADRVKTGEMPTNPAAPAPTRTDIP